MSNLNATHPNDAQPIHDPTDQLTVRQAAFLDGLRVFIDRCETTPDLIPDSGLTIVKGVHRWGGEAPAVQMARLAVAAGGKWEKRSDGDTFDLIGFFGPHKMILFTSQENVCERVVTTETITREIPDPSVEVPLVTVTEEVEQIEWKCPESLLAERLPVSAEDFGDHGSTENPEF